MCYRADEMSMKLMMGALNIFFVVFGLKANLEKSLLYIAGLPLDFKEVLFYLST